MRKALASVVIIAFTGLITTSLLAVFSSTHLGQQYMQSQNSEYPYYVIY